MNPRKLWRRTFLTSSLGALVSVRLAAQENQTANQQRAVAPVKVGNPEPFTSKNGKIKGWKLIIPGNRPLATPSVVDSKVFIGGGFGPKTSKQYIGALVL